MASVNQKISQDERSVLNEVDTNESELRENKLTRSALNTKEGKQLRQLSLNFEPENAISTTCDLNHDKVLKVKGKKSREMGSLEDNEIIPSRLRSNSGKLYTSSVSVAAHTSSNLDTVREEENCNLEIEEEDTENLKMCPREECCKGTNTLITMISKLQKSVDGVLKKVSQQEIISSNTSLKVEEIEEKVNQNANEIDDVNKELHESKFQLKVVADIVIKQDEQINLLKQKITEMQKREMSANIVISGIPENKNEKPLVLFNSFVQKALELQELIPANKAFRIGTGRNRPLLVELRHSENKSKLFANATKLKGKVNQNGKPYFLSEHLPEELNEDRRRANAIFVENKKKPSSHICGDHNGVGICFMQMELQHLRESLFFSIEVCPVKLFMNL